MQVACIKNWLFVSCTDKNKLYKELIFTKDSNFKQFVQFEYYIKKNP